MHQVAWESIKNGTTHYRRKYINYLYFDFLNITCTLKAT